MEDEEGDLSLGDIIRRQRELQAMSVRQFAEMAGISNPYLSQIERGLRRPSEQVVEAIARTLRMSADMLYEQAGMTEPQPTEEPEPEPSGSAVVEAIQADAALTPRQRQALLEVYAAFTNRPAASARGRRRAAAASGRAAPPSP